MTFIDTIREVITGFTQTDDLKKTIRNFPATFAQAQIDWAKFKEGNKRGLFTPGQVQDILDWYHDFPRLWETIRPNFEDVMLEQTGSVNVNFLPSVDAWVATLKSDPEYSGLQIAPVVIAGILIIGGVAAALWAIGYVKKQMNLSKLIDGVTAGKIPADVLRDAVNKEQSNGPLGDLKDIAKYAAIGLALWFIAPVVIDLFKKKGPARA